MTVEPQRRRFQPHRRERRTIPPFGDGTNPARVSLAIGSALESCLFAPFPDASLTSDRTYFLREHEYDVDLEPRFTFSTKNVERLAKSVGAESKDLRLSVSARARHLKRYLPLREWELDAVPGRWSLKPEELRKLQSRSDISFIVAIRVVSDSPKLKEYGLETGRVLSRREFSVRKQNDSPFPVEWIDFEDTGYPTEMLWVINWKDREDLTFALPVEEVLTVWMNKRANEPLQKIAEVRESVNLGWKMLAAEITTELWWEVLTKIEDVPDENDADTLAGQVFSQLAGASGLSYLEVKEILSNDDNGRTELRRHVSEVLKVVV